MNDKVDVEVKVEVEVKVTKKSQATVIFNSMLEQKKAGEFETMKAFRQTAIERFQNEIADVSGSAACTLYNQCKIVANAADPELKLGRDPKKVKPAKVSKKVDPKVSEEVAPEGTPIVVQEDGKFDETANTDTVVDNDPIAELDNDLLYTDTANDVCDAEHNAIDAGDFSDHNY